MRSSLNWKKTALLLLFVFCFGLGWPAQPSQQEIETADDFSYARIYTDADGVTHFGVAVNAFTLADFAPPAPPISVSQGMKVESVVYISSPPGWYGDWHPAPQRQIMFCLAGELEVRVSDGEVRTFGPGSVVLVEDTEGRGHVSRVVGDERVIMAALSLEDGSEPSRPTRHSNGPSRVPGAGR